MSKLKPYQNLVRTDADWEREYAKEKMKPCTELKFTKDDKTSDKDTKTPKS